VRSAHDCSDGGLAVALAECCVMNRNRPLGVSIDLSAFSDLPRRAVLYGEAQGRVVVSTPDAVALREIVVRHGVPCREIGHVLSADDDLEIIAGAEYRLYVSLPVLDRLYYETIPGIMAQAAAAVVSAATESPV